MIQEAHCTSPSLDYGYFNPRFSCIIGYGGRVHYSNEDFLDLRGCDVRTHFEQEGSIISVRTKDAYCVSALVRDYMVLICRPELEQLVEALNNIKEEYEALEWYGLNDKEAQRVEALLKL